MYSCYKFLVVIGLIGISGACFGQHNQVLKSEKEEMDSIAIQQRKFLSSTILYLKTQYPIQHGIGLEVATPFFLSTHAGVGQLSRFYTRSALEFLPQEDDTQVKRKEFVQDRLEMDLFLNSGQNTTD